MKQLYKLCRAAALCLTVTLLVPGLLHAQKRTLTAYPSTKVDNFIGGFYTSLPASYSSGSKSYPLLICLHGIGEIGDGSSGALSAVLRNGPIKQINEQFVSGKNANFPDPVTVNGKSFEFIVVAPQLNQWPVYADESTAMNDMINYCVNHYRIDASKIYLTGLSMGGGVTWDYAGSNNTNKLAAIVVVAGAASPSAGAVSQMVKYHLPVWATHNQTDPTVPTSATIAWVDQLNTAGANPKALINLFGDSGHGGWVKTYGDVNQTGITNSSGQNVYQWMLQYKRSGDNVIIDNGGATQAPPSVSAGSTQTITLPAAVAQAAATSTSTSLTGSASTSGSISSYQWSQASGPNTASFSNAKAAQTTVSGLIQGTYVFKLTATDNMGQASSAQVNVIVNAAPVTTVFTVNAGPDVTITLPTNSAKITGTTTVQNTTVSSSKWKQVSGPNTATIANSGTITPTISGVIAGTYVFEIDLTSAAGTTATDQVKLTVNPAPVIPVFTVNAGPDVTITLPTNSAKITGTTTVQNTTVSSSKWKQVSGPNTATIANSGTITPTISGVIAGTYVFEIDLTSTAGKTVTDQMTLKVNAAPVASVFTVNAGTNLTISLPTSSVKLAGVATVQGETIASCTWKQISGPSLATISNGSTITPTISNYIGGTYIFQVTITSASGKTASDQMTLQINPAAVFAVSAGSDLTITLPTNSVKIAGAATVQYTTLASCTWKQVSGPNTATIANNGTITPTVGGVIAGAYVFQVTITSAAGTTATDQVKLTVNPAPVTSVFTVSAGSDITVTLPTSGVQITGIATVKGETVSSCKWKQVSGPNTTTVVNSGTIAPTVSNLVAGTYVFEVDMVSASGKTATDRMTMTVNAAAVSTVFTANAGPDVFITLPANSWKITGTCIVKGVSVATCKWKQVSGPNTSVISGGGSISPVVSNLITGTYVFEVDIASTTGLHATDQMQLKVTTSSSSSTGRAATINGADLTDSATSTASLKLYPNPIQIGQQLVVEGQGVKTGTVKIVIYDISGRQAKQVVVENQSTDYFRQPISIDGFARGMYILSLSAGGEKPKLFKFVVQ